MADQNSARVGIDSPERLADLKEWVYDRDVTPTLLQLLLRIKESS